MRPKFNHPKQKVLWYIPYYGSAILAVLALFLYERQQINLAALITIIVVLIAMYAGLVWWAYRTRRMQIESEIIDEAKKSNAAEIQNGTKATQRVNVYNITVPSSSTKVIMEVVTVFLLLAAWGILWTHGWENLFSTLVMTIASAGALIAARFPFFMSDAEDHKDMSQVLQAVKKEQIYALIFAIMAVFSPLLKLEWSLIELLIVYLIVDYFFSRKKESEMSLEQQKAISSQAAEERFDTSDIYVERNKETIVFEVVTGFIILMAVCITLLSYNVIKSDLMRYGIRIMFILLLSYSAINQLVKAVKFAKAEKGLKNMRQFNLAIRENRVYGLEFAIAGLIVAISIKHHIIDPGIFIVAVLATTFGTYFFFKRLINKAQ